MIFGLIITAAILAFILEFFDASAGMGYGILTPVLLLLGFPPLEVVSAVIITSAALSLLAGFLHHGFVNIDFLTRKNLKIMLILVTAGIVAILVGVFTAVTISENALKIYIGLLTVGVGILILMHKKNVKFSWIRLMMFGSLASFNKGISGGGYGPVLAGGQIMSGVKSKHAVSLTALSEGIVCAAGFLGYLFVNRADHMNWSLILSLLIGGAISTPLAVYAVKKIDPQKLKIFIAVTSIAVGSLIIGQLFAF